MSDDLTDDPFGFASIKARCLQALRAQGVTVDEDAISMNIQDDGKWLLSIKLPPDTPPAVLNAFIKMIELRG